MSRYKSLKKVKEMTVRKEVFNTGKFYCADGTYTGSDGVLQVELINVHNTGADIIIGGTYTYDFRVNKQTALVLSEFFKELSNTLD